MSVVTGDGAGRGAGRMHERRDGCAGRALGLLPADSPHATEQDLAMQKRNEQAEKEAFDIAIDRIAEHKLEMKLGGREYASDRSKNHLLFHRQRPRGFPHAKSRAWRVSSRPASSCARSCARRGEDAGVNHLRAADLLPDVFERLHAGLHQDGEGAESSRSIRRRFPARATA